LKKISNYSYMNKARLEGKKIVCLGGGNAMPKAVLAGLKKFPVKISVICAMLDTGGSAGRLRKDYGIVSPGDIRRAFIALANTSPAVGELFNYRFDDGELAGHNFANLLITALELSSKNYKATLKELNRLLNINPNHKVLPATLDKAELCAELDNGEIIRGETNIDIPKHDAKHSIKKIFLEPEAKAYGAALHEIKDADAIIIGPGDLYSSLAQILLVKGMARAICKSRAQKIYICNLHTKHGETDHYSVEDFTGKIEEFLGCPVDKVIFSLQTKTIRRKIQSVELKGKPNGKFVGAAVSSSENPEEHDPVKLSKIILSII